MTYATMETGIYCQSCSQALNLARWFEIGYQTPYGMVKRQFCKECFVGMAGEEFLEPFEKLEARQKEIMESISFAPKIMPPFKAVYGPLGIPVTPGQFTAVESQYGLPIHVNKNEGYLDPYRGVVSSPKEKAEPALIPFRQAPPEYSSAEPKKEDSFMDKLKKMWK